MHAIDIDIIRVTIRKNTLLFMVSPHFAVRNDLDGIPPT